MQTISITIYLVAYFIIVAIAWYRHLKHEGYGVMMILSSVLLFAYPAILITIFIDNLKTQINKYRK